MICRLKRNNTQYMHVFSFSKKKDGGIIQLSLHMPEHYLLHLTHTSHYSSSQLRATFTR
jgi:hypothetical protein